MKRWSELGLLLLIAAGALVFRLPDLGLRPLHNDEAINAFKLEALWAHGRYAYDPHEYHGPSLHYASLPFLWLSGVHQSDQLTDARLRLVTVAFGAGLILLLALTAEALGWSATLIAGGLLAISPAMVFYSRYFIHEMLLVFFTALLLAAGWRYWRTRQLGWAMLAGAALGLMYATKETFVIPLAAMIAALLLTALWNHWRKSSSVKSEGSAAATPGEVVSWRALLPVRTLVAAVGVAAVISLTLFTSFFTNLSGPLDSVRTYAAWLHRAGGASPHIHPWNFYLERLIWFHPAHSPVWSEGLIVLLAVIGGGAGLLGRGLGPVNAGLARFLAFYTVILTAGYSAIAYKTPWCLLGFLHPMILLAGVGATVVVRGVHRPLARGLAGLVLLAAAVQLGGQAYRANFGVTAAGRLLAADPRNPYVYAQTLPDVRPLVARLQDLARVSPQGRDLVIKVISPESYWPLPWYLRQFRHVGWWDQMPTDPYAPVVITSASLHAALDDKSQKKWLQANVYELRPGVFLELYVELELWRKCVESLPRPRDE